MKSSRLVLIENTDNTQERGKIADGYADVAEHFLTFFLICLNSDGGKGGKSSLGYYT